MEPYGEFTVIDTKDILVLVVYGTYTLIICFLVEWLRREQYNAKMAVLVGETSLKLLVEGDQKTRAVMRKALTKNA